MANDALLTEFLKEIRTLVQDNAKFLAAVQNIEETSEKVLKKQDEVEHILINDDNGLRKKITVCEDALKPDHSWRPLIIELVKIIAILAAAIGGTQLL